MFERVSYPEGTLGVSKAIDRQRGMELSVIQAAPDNQIAFRLTIGRQEFRIYGEYESAAVDGINWTVLRPHQDLLHALQKINPADPLSIIDDAVKTYSAPMRKPVSHVTVQIYGRDLDLFGNAMPANAYKLDAARSPLDDALARQELFLD